MALRLASRTSRLLSSPKPRAMATASQRLSSSAARRERMNKWSGHAMLPQLLLEVEYGTNNSQQNQRAGKGRRCQSMNKALFFLPQKRTWRQGLDLPVVYLESGPRTHGRGSGKVRARERVARAGHVIKHIATVGDRSSNAGRPGGGVEHPPQSFPTAGRGASQGTHADFQLS